MVLEKPIISLSAMLTLAKLVIIYILTWSLYLYQNVLVLLFSLSTHSLSYQQARGTLFTYNSRTTISFSISIQTLRDSMIIIVHDYNYLHLLHSRQTLNCMTCSNCPQSSGLGVRI